MKATYNLILAILDLRVLPLNRFDMSNETYLYFIDCLLATLEMLYCENSMDLSFQEVKTEKFVFFAHFYLFIFFLSFKHKIIKAKA